MSNEKLEPRLVEAIETQKRRAESEGRSSRTVDEADKFEVTISHHERVPAQEDAVGGAGLGELSERTGRSQASIVDRIREVAPDAPIKQHTLANAITTALTPAEMKQVAEIDEVSIVRLERFDQVTTMNDSVSVIEVRDAWEEFRHAGRGVSRRGARQRRRRRPPGAVRESGRPGEHGGGAGQHSWNPWDPCRGHHRQ